jgi:DNA-directed RNA polymerase subunit alpha
LLSAIPGTGVVWAKVGGVAAGAEKVSGVEEDLANLLLNLKKMVVRLAGHADTGSARLEVRGPRAATGADFTGDGIDVVTPDLHLATVAAGGKLTLAPAEGTCPPTGTGTAFPPGPSASTRRSLRSGA